MKKTIIPLDFSEHSEYALKADGNSDKLPSVHYVNDYTVAQGVFNF